MEIKLWNSKQTWTSLYKKGDFFSNNTVPQSCYSRPIIYMWKNVNFFHQNTIYVPKNCLFLQFIWSLLLIIYIARIKWPRESHAIGKWTWYCKFEFSRTDSHIVTCTQECVLSFRNDKQRDNKVLKQSQFIIIVLISFEVRQAVRHLQFVYS